METLTATEFGIPAELVSVLSDEASYTEVGARGDIDEKVLEDGTHTWSIRPESSVLSLGTLSRQKEEELAVQTLRLICFACPPCYEGKVNWYLSPKEHRPFPTNPTVGPRTRRKQFGGS